MKKHIKRGIILRTMSGFLAVWLIFSGLISWVLIRQSATRTDSELAQVLVNNILPAEVENMEQLENILNSICRSDTRIKAGAAFRHIANFRLLAESTFPGTVLVAPKEGSTTRSMVRFFPLAFLTGEQVGQLTTWMKECQERQEKAYQENTSGDYFPVEAVDLFVSGWIRGDVLYPDRLVAVHRFRDLEDHQITGEPADLSGQEIWMDVQVDTAEVYQKQQDWLERGRYVENLWVLNHYFFDLEANPIQPDVIREALPLAHNEALRQAARRESSALPDLEVLIFRDGQDRFTRVSLLSSRQRIEGLKNSTPKPGPVGLKPGQCVLYTQKGDVEFSLVAEAHPIRELLPTLAGVWLASLVLVLAAGGLVCRAMCRVYDRQAALERSRRETTNALAHDLKTPLSLIRGYAENLSLRVRPEKHDHYLLQIQKETDRMDGILGGLLEFSRLETGTLPLHREPVDLRALAEESVSRWQLAAEARLITLSDEGSGTVSADRELFGRALDNLLSNALRHTPEGGSIRITVSENRLSVENTGAPIPEDELPRLFEAYYTGDRSRSGGRQHGLGLAIVRVVAERHGMTAEVRNTETGSCFSIIF